MVIINGSRVRLQEDSTQSGESIVHGQSAGGGLSGTYPNPSVDVNRNKNYWYFIREFRYGGNGGTSDDVHFPIQGARQFWTGSNGRDVSAVMPVDVKLTEWEVKILVQDNDGTSDPHFKLLQRSNGSSTEQTITDFVMDINSINTHTETLTETINEGDAIWCFYDGFSSGAIFMSRIEYEII